MTRKSPHIISYSDLLSLSEEVLEQRTAWYKGAVGMGAKNLDYHVHKMQTAKVLVRMLKKGLPGKQTDFLELFKEVNQ